MNQVHRFLHELGFLDLDVRILSLNNGLIFVGDLLDLHCLCELD